ncbi:MAG: glycosyltransferase [Patescibacteria group bacterium]
MVLRILREVYKRKIIVKFIISGGTAAFTDLGLLYVLTSLAGYWYLFSAILAFIAAFFVSFFLQKFWTFRDNDRKKMYSQMRRYFFVGLVNLGINTLGMYLVVDIFGIWYLLAQILVSIVIAAESFLIYKHAIFNGKDAPPADRGEKKLKILIATGIYPPDYRGPATLLEALPGELTGRGMEVKIITYSHIKTRPEEVGRVYRILNRPVRIISQIQYFLTLWRLSDRADVIYALDVYSAGYFTYLMKKIKGISYVVRFVGDSAWETAVRAGWTRDYILDFQDKVYDKKIEKLKARRKKILLEADRIVAPSDFIGLVLERIGAKKEKIKVIYNSLDFSRYPFNEAFISSIKEKYGRDGKIIVSPGQLNPWKGFDGVIRMLPGLMKELNMKINLLILGKGQEIMNLEKLARERGVSGNVHFLGKIEHEKIMDYFKAADLFILNSNYEGMSHVLLEAMQSGTPIITTKSGGNPEVIADNENGLLINYNNEEELIKAAKKMLTDDEFAREMSVNAKGGLKIFSWEKTVDETADVLKACF